MAALQGYVSSKVEGACSMHCSQQEQLFFFFSSCFVDIEPPQALFSSQHVQLKVDTTMTLSALVRQIQSATILHHCPVLSLAHLYAAVLSC